MRPELFWYQSQTKKLQENYRPIPLMYTNARIQQNTSTLNSAVY